MMEKVDVQELATLLADPRQWLEDCDVDDLECPGDDREALLRLAAFLVKETEDARQREYVAWCKEHNLNGNTNEAHYLYYHLLPAVVLCREIVDDYRAEADELRKEIDELKRTIKAVERTQQLHNDRLNLVVP